MGWQDKYGTQEKKSGGGGGLFLKLADKDRAELIIPERGEPRCRYRFWNGASFEDRDGPGVDVRRQVVMPVFVVSLNGQPVNDAKILELSSGTFDDLLGKLAHPRVGGHEQVYEISRSGEKKDTRWTIARIDRADAATLQRVERAHLPECEGHPLPTVDATEIRAARSAGVTANGVDPMPHTPAHDDADIPF